MLAAVAMACHVWDRHLATLHQAGAGAAAEEFCTDVDVDAGEHPQVTDSAVNSWVAQALNRSGSVEDWEAVNGILFSNRGDCDNFTVFELEDIELHYRVLHIPAACEGAPGCAIEEPFCASHPDSGHLNCDYFDIFLSAFFFEGGDTARNNVINHETGHALGLADPECVADPNYRDGAPACQATNEGEDCFVRIKFSFLGTLFSRSSPVLSVMHTTGYCCPDLDVHRQAGTGCEDHWPPGDLPFPSAYDRAIAQLIADNHPSVSGN